MNFCVGITRWLGTMFWLKVIALLIRIFKYDPCCRYWYSKNPKPRNILTVRTVAMDCVFWACKFTAAKGWWLIEADRGCEYFTLNFRREAAEELFFILKARLFLPRTMFHGLHRSATGLRIRRKVITNHSQNRLVGAVGRNATKHFAGSLI